MQDFRLPLGVPLRGVTITMIRMTILIVCFMVAIYGYDRFRQPYEFHSVTILNPAIKSTEPLEVQFSFDRKRICKSVSERIITNDKGKVVYRRSFLSGVGAIQDNAITTTQVRIDTPLPAGRYSLTYVIDSTCGANKFTYTPPAAYFQIVEPDTLPLPPELRAQEKGL